MGELVAGWNPYEEEEESVVFRTDDEQLDSQGSSDYFLDSGDKVHFFLEQAAVDEATGRLARGRSKTESLNKVGHGLHIADPAFRAYSESDKVALLARALGWVDPVLPQSMYIFKQPMDGDAVTSHQDSAFLYTEPRQTCLGLWLALEDATLDNGCIWARPGSHREELRRHFCRKQVADRWGSSPGATTSETEERNGEDGDTMIFRDLLSPEWGGDGSPSPAPWDGGMPGGIGIGGGGGEDEEGGAEAALEAAGFVAYPCKAGDLVLIHGSVDHLSMQNTSPKSRHTFQLHLVEGPSQGVEWSKGNWLQTPGKPFPKLEVSGR